LPDGILKHITAIYPGTFDPPTNGHLDLIERGASIFNELVVAILSNADKSPLFSVNERMDMLRQCTQRYENVRVVCFQGLMIDCATQNHASAVLRGIRAVSDYEYELQMAWINRKMSPDLETIFMMPAEDYAYLSSKLVRQISQLGGSVHGLVPDGVEQRLRERFIKQAAQAVDNIL
jgi:pantetheine-phosphate adenylyltransferase